MIFLIYILCGLMVSGWLVWYEGAKYWVAQDICHMDHPDAWIDPEAFIMGIIGGLSATLFITFLWPLALVMGGVWIVCQRRFEKQ